VRARRGHHAPAGAGRPDERSPAQKHCMVRRGTGWHGQPIELVTRRALHIPPPPSKTWSATCSAFQRVGWSGSSGAGQRAEAVQGRYARRLPCSLPSETAWRRRGADGQQGG
jgi:hypothetical protein